MSNHHLFGAADPDFGDSAFEARSSFDFEDDLNHPGHHMTAFQDFPGQAMDFEMVGEEYGDSDSFDQQFFHDRADSMTPQNLFLQGSNMSNVDAKSMLSKTQASQNFGRPRPSMPALPSSQSTIVHSRSKNVSQQFGQITPPDEKGPESFKMPRSKQSQPQHAQNQDGGKLSNEQRARNAANTRHSRSKGVKKTRGETDGDSDGEGAQKQGKNITIQREKNRVAAAKCRAKKKSANEQQEELANEYGTTNNHLTREIRELKNQKSELQNFLLAHRPGVCECHGIHDYNIGQAHRLVLNARRQVVHNTSSPSRDSETQSPGSENSGSVFSAANRISRSETMNMPPRYPSFDAPMNYPFSQDMTSEGMQLGEAIAREGQQMSQDFADFLKSSPDGRAGFS